MNFGRRSHVWAAETGGGAGGEGGDSGAGDGGAGGAGAGAGAAAGTGTGAGGEAGGDGGDAGKAAAAAAKVASDLNPHKVPDKFLTEGKPDYAKLVTSYGEAERALMRKATEVRADVEKSFREERVKAAPATPADYTVEDKFILGDREITVLKDDPMMSFVRTVAHANQWTQQQFNENVRGYVAQQLAALPKWDAEAKLLGPLADQRHQRVDGFLKANLSADSYNTFARQPATAAVIKALEEVMEVAGHPRMTDDTTVVPRETLSRDELRKMQNDPRYTGERGKEIEPAFVQRVRAGYRALAARGNGRS